MASFNPTAISFLLLPLLFLAASARPCKTLFISSYSFSIKPLFPNPNPNPRNPSPTFVAVVTEISTTNNPQFFLHDDSTPRHPHHPHQDDQHQSIIGFSYDIGSLRDRSKDILSVVVALLFGVGCGALTAATMYLVWTLFAYRYDYRSSYEFYDDDVEDEKVDVKKMGYVKIPHEAVKETV